jgi:Transglycosylase SLT domain
MVMLMLAVATVLTTDAARAASPGVLGSGLAVIPAHYVTWYREAARTCRGLSWPVLAGIGTIESDNGRSTARGVHQGKNRKGAEGPMQFEPATFAEYAVRADWSGKLTPYDPKDAIFTAARMLCADGAYGGSRKGLNHAIFAYNHACWYVTDVLAMAARYSDSRPRLRHISKRPRTDLRSLGSRTRSHRGRTHLGQGRQRYGRSHDARRTQGADSGCR